jgi:hypothetical protein
MRVAVVWAVIAVRFALQTRCPLIASACLCPLVAIAKPDSAHFATFACLLSSYNADDAWLRLT